MSPNSHGIEASVAMNRRAASALPSEIEKRKHEGHGSDGTAVNVPLMIERVVFENVV